MSTPFRVFLLILAAAGVLWAYRARSTDIRHWLRNEPVASARRGNDLISPVNRLVDPDATRASVWLQGRDPGRHRTPEPEPSRPDPVYEPTPEDELLAADMPAVDGFAAENAGAPAGDDGAAPPAPGPAEEVPAVVESEPAPEPRPELEAYEEVTHVLQSGESLWSVAARYLGSGIRYREIQELNRDAIPDGGDVVPAGTPLRIRISAREKGLKPGRRENDTSVEENSGRQPPSGGAGTGGLLHTVRKDENLQRIARKYFPEDRDAWRVLYDANQDARSSPDTLRVGQVLRIPSRPGKP